MSNHNQNHAVLVTGGAGYIGSVTVETLRAAGRPVVVLDNLSRGHRAAVDPQVPFYEGDIAAAIIAQQEEQGGLMTREDLAGYRAEVEAPARARFGEYDGDTPPDQRRAARDHGRIIATNPDMLHHGVLPHHPLMINPKDLSMIRWA